MALLYYVHCDYPEILKYRKMFSFFWGSDWFMWNIFQESISNYIIRMLLIFTALIKIKPNYWDHSSFFHFFTALANNLLTYFLHFWWVSIKNLVSSSFNIRSKSYYLLPSCTILYLYISTMIFFIFLGKPLLFYIFR